MTLKQLLSRQGWLNIAAALQNEYPAEHQHLSDYEAVYDQLLLLPEAETDLQIVLKTIRQIEVGESYVDVYGKKWPPHIADASLQLCYALDFTPWAEWLAMPIAVRTLHNFTEAEIIAHCLWKMTSHSFDENVIQDEKRRLTLTVPEVSDTTNEAYWQQLINRVPLTLQLNKEE